MDYGNIIANGIIESNLQGRLAEKLNATLAARDQNFINAAIYAVFSMVDAVVKAKIIPDQSIEKLDILLALRTGDTARLGALLGVFCKYCHDARQYMSHGQPPAQATADTPQKIEIVGLPERVTTQNVTRDENDEITSTFTLQKDA